MVLFGVDDVERLERNMCLRLERTLLRKFCYSPDLHINFRFDACDPSSNRGLLRTLHLHVGARHA